MKLCLFFMVVFCLRIDAQKLTITANEKRWAALHPVAALKVKYLNKKLTTVYTEIKSSNALDSFSNGGKLDAFRHCFYMAAFAQKIKVQKLRSLGVAHERGNYAQFLKSFFEEGEVPDSLSSVMDLRNNELGFSIGIAHKNVDLDALKMIVIEKIKSGDAFIMNRNKQGFYLDCNNLLLEIPKLKLPWNLPKCLVASNLIYKD
jgi:hypothetical protein